MINFNFEGKEVSVASEWNEVTVKHFIMPEFLSGNSIELLSALSGIPATKLANATPDTQKHFNKTVAFLNADVRGWQGKAGATSLKLMGVKCKIPKNIELESFGKKIMMGDVIAKHAFIYEAIPAAIAIYLGEQIYPDDWYKRIDEIAEEVLKLPINKVYSITAFFLTLSKSYRRNGQGS